MTYRFVYIASFFFFMLLLGSPMQGYAKPLNAAVKSGRSLGIEFEVGYHNLDSSDTNYLPTAKAYDVVNSFSNIMHHMVGDLGFARPWRTGIGDWFPSEAFALSPPGRLGTAYAHKIDLDAPFMRKHKRVETESLCAHELFHTIQRRYINGDITGLWIFAQLGGFGVESTAEAFTDFTFSRVDTNSRHFASFAASLATYNPGKRLFDRTYDGALFWKYASEQLGSVTNEPERGVDFFIEVFDEILRLSSASIFPNDKSLINALPIVLKRHNTNLQDLYANFALCNGIHALGLSPRVKAQLGGGDSVRYYDDVGNWWGYPKAHNFSTLPFQGGSAVPALGTEYYRYRRSTNAPSCSLVGVRVMSMKPTDVAIAGVSTGLTVMDLTQNRAKETVQTFIISPDPDGIRDILLCVSSGTAKSTWYNYEFVEGDLTPPAIISPTVRVPAIVPLHPPYGVFHLPIQVRVEGPDELKPSGAYPRSVAGLTKKHFRVTTMTGTNAPKNVMYIGGDYFLDQICWIHGVLTPGYYSTEVAIQCGSNSVSDIGPNSVLVTNEPVHHVLVLDRSGSMNLPSQGLKFSAMKEAAALYISSLPTAHGLALIAFDGNRVEPDEDATVIYSDPGGRTDNGPALAALKNLQLGNMTSIGDGLWAALDELDAMRGPDPALEYITLLTDGIENEGRFVNKSSLAGPPVMSRLTNTTVHVHTIALGPDSDTALMQGIARKTDGAYSYVDVSGGAMASSMSMHSALAAGSSPSGLAAGLFSSVRLQTMHAFLNAREETEEMERFFTHSASVVSGQTYQVQLDLDASAVTNGLFLVAWNATNAAPDITLYDPSGVQVDAANALVSTGRTFALYRFERELPRGSFDLVVTPHADMDLMAAFSGHSVDPFYFVFRFGQLATGGTTGSPEDALLEQFEQGVPVQMQAYIASTNGPLRNVDIDVTITLPDGSTYCGPSFLRDDGSQMDLLPNDGVYGLIFTKTAQASTIGIDRETNSSSPEGPSGSYRIDARAQAVDPLGQPISREYHGDFQIYRRVEQRDSDLDGIPDSWEIFYHTDPYNTLDGAEDPDEDGLVNSNEYVAGTEPFNPDTDAGGEADGSEISAGRCPFDPVDDDLPPMYDYQVVEDTGCIDPTLLLKPFSITLRWGTHPRFETMRIFRSTQPTNGFVLVTNITPHAMGDNIFYDRGLSAGSKYFYRLQPVSPLGALGPFSDPIEGTAWSNAIPPSGVITLQPPADRTDRLLVPVFLRASASVTNFVISSSPLDGTEVVSPFVPVGTQGEMIFDLELDPPEPGIDRLRVYARFQDVEGRWSHVVRASIRYDPDGDSDGDGNPNATDTDDDNDGLTDDAEIYDFRTDPFDPDTDGDGLTDAGEIDFYATDPLTEDSDGDSVTDWDEIVVYETDPRLPDSDGDQLNDGFEIRYGFNPTIDEGITFEDTDFDGMDNLTEALTGTDPRDPSSVFNLRFVSSESGTLKLSFPAKMGQFYRLLYRNQITDPEWQDLGSYTADHATMSIDLSGSSEASTGFYRVQFERNPALSGE